MAQFQIGFFSESLKSLFSTTSSRAKFEGIIDSLCSFNLTTNSDLIHVTDESLVMVANNLISRGIPTKPSVFVEDLLANTFSKTTKHINDQNQISYAFNDESSKESIYRALHVVDPRISKNEFVSKPNSLANSSQISQFLAQAVVPNLGDQFLQLFSQDRNQEQILRNMSTFNDDADVFLENPEYDFLKKSIELSLETPYSTTGKKAIAIDLELFVDDTTRNYILENLKTEFYSKLNWAEHIVVKTNDHANVDESIKKLQEFTYNEYFDNISKNYKSPLYRTSEGLEAMQIALTPLGVARIQKTLIEFILAGKLSLNAKVWKIAVIERDVPCAFVAIEDFKQLFKNLFVLEDLNRILPAIQLTIYRSEEFERAELNLLYQGTILAINDFDSQADYDILIDISILQRDNMALPQYQSKAIERAFIRTSSYKTGKRKFYFGKPITYLSAKLTEDINLEDREISIEQSLSYFLKNLFRNYEFLPNQSIAIQKALQMESLALISAPATGKTLCYQFAAQLQPAISAIVHPHMAIMKEQFDALRKEQIDGCIYINSSQRKALEKEQTLEMFVKNEVQFLFISPERLLIPAFRETLQKVSFAALIVDEAHCVSEWSHDFRLEYKNLGIHAKKYLICKSEKTLPVWAFTSTASYHVCSDFIHEFNIPEQNILRFVQIETNRLFHIVDSGKNSITALTEMDEAKKLITGEKKQAIVSLLKDLYVGSSAKKSLIFLPSFSGLMGANEGNAESIAYHIKTSVPELASASFAGTIDDGLDSVSGSDAQIASENYRKFQNEELNLLLSVKTMGIGANFKNLNRCIFTNIPDSPWSLFQLFGRTGRIGQQSDVYVIFDNQMVRTKEIEFRLDEKNEIIPVQNNLDSTVDKFLLHEILRKKYRGSAKETKIMMELLENINFPVEIPINILTDLVEKEFGIIVTFVTQPGTNPYQVHVNRANKTYGFIDFRTNNINTSYSTFDKEQSNRILMFVKNEILHRCPQDKDICNWVESTIAREEIGGISKILNGMQIGEKREIRFMLTNGIGKQLADLLMKTYPNKMDEKIVKACLIDSSNPFDFLQKIKKETSIDISLQNKVLTEELKKIYFAYRDEYDTITAITKLNIAGILEHYSIDFATQMVTLVLVKKEEKEYLNSVFEYQKRYYHVSFANKVFTDVDRCGGADFYEKLMKYMIQFFYETIYTYKVSSIHQMGMICQEGIIEQDKQKYSQLVNKSIEVMQVANYLNPFSAQNLEKEMLNKNTFTYKVVENYISQVGFSLENLKHLRKSTELLLQNNPENHVIMLLYVYSCFMLGYKDETEFEQLYNNLNNAFAWMKNSEKLGFEEYSKKQSDFYSKIFENSKEIRKKIEPMVQLKYQTNWLTDFNKKFLQNMPMG